MSSSFTVKMGIKGLPSVALAEKGRNNVTMLTGNATYPTPTPSLAALTAACTELERCNTEVLFNGGKLAHQAKRLAVATLERMIKELAGYVQATSGGDKTKILSAGFDVRKPADRIGVLAAPQALHARISDFRGCIALAWKGVGGTRMYQVYITEGDPKEATGWTMVAVSTRTRILIDNLKTGQFYSFRVNAVGTAGESAYSEPAIAMAA
jgi:hypothetical protein